MRCYVNSEKGPHRPNNEDNFLCNEHMLEHGEDVFSAVYEGVTPGWNLFGVFDGMGGTTQGEKASFLAASVFASCRNTMTPEQGRERIDGLMREAFLSANNLVVRTVRYSGSTASVLATDGRSARVYHLGDSRVYLIREGTLRQLTRDQTVEAMKREMGLGDRVLSTDSHRLTEYLGADETLEGIRPLESEWLKLASGDRFLLCTDGLYHYSDFRELGKLVFGAAEENPAGLLTEKAILAGSSDNVTCLIIEL